MMSMQSVKIPRDHTLLLAKLDIQEMDKHALVKFMLILKLPYLLTQANKNSGNPDHFYLKTRI